MKQNEEPKDANKIKTQQQSSLKFQIVSDGSSNDRE